MVAVVKPVQARNAPPSIAYTDVGIVTVAKPVHARNALVPIDVSVEGKTKDVKLVLPGPEEYL